MEALEVLRTNGAGTFQLVLTVSHGFTFRYIVFHRRVWWGAKRAFVCRTS